ncbi:MAG TPA: DUF1178 domain-containing protein [Rhodospirillaceae bacterium]|nr:hypothetical protein [Rhodospirillaceae bacterium]HAA92325.1 DUF1178 domain-containing protein [Rhodospirillaceae bacterium]HAT36354.1 DUF1178 domain-containing protein [Rhodospirillaceae bacterium]|tara:strand:- start:738 stop:1160 length:423 start_codon:yes stop_codon:yes gene_type:complete
MILFNLRCAADHEFEAWFKDGATYDSQSAAGEISCPVCGESKIEKAPMAPRIGAGAKTKNSPSDGEKFAQVHQAMVQMREQVEKNCDYVGPDFAEEARKIHYEEADARNIYGETSDEEAQALEEEGVDFARVPWLPRTDS